MWALEDKVRAAKWCATAAQQVRAAATQRRRGAHRGPCVLGELKPCTKTLL